MRAVKNENIPSPFAAEALACLQSLKVGRDLGLREEGFRREDGWGLDQDTIELFVA
ncbi:hypothetical protein Goarm_005078, partial [Gossypium armourianum]|nr:hypothetical protein [Gossypium armourianum]